MALIRADWCVVCVCVVDYRASSRWVGFHKLVRRGHYSAEWATLQFSDVKFSRDSVHQNSCKSVSMAFGFRKKSWRVVTSRHVTGQVEFELIAKRWKWNRIAEARASRIRPSPMLCVWFCAGGDLPVDARHVVEMGPAAGTQQNGDMRLCRYITHHIT